MSPRANNLLKNRLHPVGDERRFFWGKGQNGVAIIATISRFGHLARMVVGSNPAPATNKALERFGVLSAFFVMTKQPSLSFGFLSIIITIRGEML